MYDLKQLLCRAIVKPNENKGNNYNNNNNNGNIIIIIIAIIIIIIIMIIIIIINIISPRPGNTGFHKSTSDNSKANPKCTNYW